MVSPLRSKSLKVLIPILSVNPMLGKEAGGLSASTVGRLEQARMEEHARWSKRDLYMYFWADGIHVHAKLEDASRLARRLSARSSSSA